MNCTSLVVDEGIPMMIEPILLDANGDNIADLFGVNTNQTKGKEPKYSLGAFINDIT